MQAMRTSPHRKVSGRNHYLFTGMRVSTEIPNAMARLAITTKEGLNFPDSIRERYSGVIFAISANFSEIYNICCKTCNLRIPIDKLNFIIFEFFVPVIANIIFI